MDLREVSCCFTGHRPNRLPWLDDPADVRTRALEQGLWERIVAARGAGYTRFFSGMALGVDLMCARLVLRLAETEPQVRLIPVVPYPGQATRWRSADRRLYHQILHMCGEDLVVVCPSYQRDCYTLRNRYMVDHSAIIIGVYDGGSGGGTAQTLDYARQKGLEMELIMPE